MIDRDAPDPPWVQLAAILRSRIASGEITTRLPGERALQQEFGLAPVTIRKAVRQLREEGFVRTTPGWGTYVVRRTTLRHLAGRLAPFPGHECGGNRSACCFRDHQHGRNYGACTFPGYWCGGNHRAWGGRKGVWGETWNRAAWGARGVPGFPPVIFKSPFPAAFSLTEQSWSVPDLALLLFEGVRSGTRRRRGRERIRAGSRGDRAWNAARSCRMRGVPRCAGAVRLVSGLSSRWFGKSGCRGGIAW